MGNGRDVTVAVAKQIQIARRPKRIGDPGTKSIAPFRMKWSRCDDTLSR
ncbi:hypothetical protein GGE12_004205 [Rhizobium mongolense]|uniref:Uncharacterized protein n=1 Tax=Rhizobium mongolense TaxID=57676 RepID=A0A7W6RR66_9HYPH|nr:hypothetical protein [Rhizobium mongolense]